MSRSERSIRSRQRLEQAVNAENRRKERRASLRESLSQGLLRVEKVELVDLLLRLADDQEDFGLWLADRLDMEKEPQDEVFDVESDISRATHVPEHLINHNFPYDAVAYERVGKGLERLVRRGHRDEILHEMREDEAFVDALRAANGPSLLERYRTKTAGS